MYYDEGKQLEVIYNSKVFDIDTSIERVKM